MQVPVSSQVPVSYAITAERASKTASEATAQKICEVLLVSCFTEATKVITEKRRDRGLSSERFSNMRH